MVRQNIQIALNSGFSILEIKILPDQELKKIILKLHEGDAEIFESWFNLCLILYLSNALTRGDSKLSKLLVERLGEKLE